MEQIWNRNTLSGAAAWNGGLEQMRGTDLERKYFVLNSCMEWKSVTNAWNGSGTDMLCLEQLHGTEVGNSCMEQIWNGNTLSGTAAWNGSL